MASPAQYPRIDPVVARFTPDAQIGGRQATAADFGSAESLQSVARGLGEVADTASGIADDQARTWAATASAQQELNVRQAWQQKVSSLDPTAPDYPEQVANLTQDASQTWDDAADAVQQRAPNGFASKLLGVHFADAKARFQLQAMDQQASLNAAYTSNLVKQGISADSDLVQASPDNATFTKAATRWSATIGGYKTVDPETKQKLNDYALNTLANAQAEGAVKRDPGAFLAGISPQGGIATTRGEAGQVPAIADHHANFVQPYTPQHVQAIAAKVQAPSKFDPLINASAQKNGIDPKELKLFLTAESGLDPNADNGISHGIAQMTSATAKALGVDPTKPDQAIEGAARLLANYKAKYGGDMNAVTEAYYGGSDQKQWGPNTQQYAANLSAARAYLGMDQTQPQVQPVPETAIAAAKPDLAGWDNLTWPEKVGYVRQAEAQQGKALAEQRGKLRAGLQDSIASFRNGVTPDDVNDPMYSRAYMTAVLGADAGNRAYSEYQFAKQVAGSIQQMATMPLAQRNQMVANAHSLAAGAGASTNFGMVSAMAQANARIDAQIKADPVNYAISTGINGEKPLDFSNDGTLVQSLAKRQQTMQIMTGEQGAAPAIFSKQEQQQISQHLAGLSPDARVDFLVNMRRGLTDDRAYRTAMNQIAGPHSNLAYAGNIAVHLGHVQVGSQSQSGLDVARMVAEGDAILHGNVYTGEKKAGQPGSDDPALPKGRFASPFSMADFDKAFRTAVSPAAFQSGNAGLSSRVQADVEDATAAYFAAWARHNGVDVSDFSSRDVQAGVKQAVAAVTGGVWNAAPNHGVLFAPWGMPIQQFQDEWGGRAQQAFKSAGYDDQQTEQWLRNATPVNVGDGRYQFMYRGVTVNAPGTQSPVTVSYGDPLPQVPPAAPAGQAPADGATQGLQQVLGMFAGRGR